MFWVESWEVRVFLWGGVASPPTRVTSTRPPLWGISVPSSILFRLLGLLCHLLWRRHLLPLSGLMDLPVLARCSVGGGVLVLSVALSLPSPPSPPLPFPYPYSLASSAPSPGPLDSLGLLWLCRSLATMWAAPRREVNDSGYNGLGLLFGRPPPP